MLNWVLIQRWALRRRLEWNIYLHGPCLPIRNSEWKMKWILTSIELGIEVFLMPLTWLFIAQDRRTYWALFGELLGKEITQRNAALGVREVWTGSIKPETTTIEPSNMVDSEDLPIQISTAKQTYNSCFSVLNNAPRVKTCFFLVFLSGR